MSWTSSRDRLIEAILGVLWAQWTELGVGGTRGAESSLIDPEALLLASSRFARYDPRLFDEVLDWLTHNSAYLDVTRLRRLGAMSLAPDIRVLTVLTDFMREQSATQKWEGSVRSLVAREARATYAGPVALFLGRDGGPLPTFGALDPFFLQHGFERPELQLRRLSRPPDSRRTSLGRLRLRALVGHGARAEVLCFLATHKHAHGRLISQRAGFAQRQVAEYLAMLTDSGFAERWEDGRTVQYRLAPAFSASLGEFAPYVDWVGVWSALAQLWAAVEIAEGRPGDYAAAKSWREALTAVRTAGPVEGVEFMIPVPEDYPGERILGYAEQHVLRVAEVVESLAR